MSDRRYALTKLDAGRYLLHGNDVEPTLAVASGTVFLLARWEDGPELGAPRRRTVWTLSAAPWATVRSTIERNLAGWGDPLDGVEWEHVAEHPTRTAAVAEAVQISEARRLARTQEAQR